MSEIIHAGEVSSSSPRPRIVFVDVLKFVLMFSVVWGHCIQFSNKDFDQNFIFRMLYSFHMPLFMVLCGYVGFSREVPWDRIGHRSLRLLLPFFSWFFLTWAMQRQSSLPGALLALLKSPDIGLWFLWCLFLCMILFKLVSLCAARLKIERCIVEIVVVLVLYAFTLVFKSRILGVHFLAWYFPFFVLGVNAQRFQFLEFVCRHHKSVLISFGLLFGVLAAFWMRKDPPLFYSYFSLGPYFPFLYRLITALAGCVFFFTLFYLWVPHWPARIQNDFAAGGKITLGIYAVHYCFIGWGIRWMPHFYQAALCSALVTFAVTILAVIVLQKWRLTALVLLGETASSKKSGEVPQASPASS